MAQNDASNATDPTEGSLATRRVTREGLPNQVNR